MPINTIEAPGGEKKKQLDFKKNKKIEEFKKTSNMISEITFYS